MNQPSSHKSATSELFSGTATCAAWTEGPWTQGHRPLMTLLLGMIVLLTASEQSVAQITLRDICRVKGQEEIQLHGLGLVIGLAGTGGGDRAALAAMVRSMELMGMPVGGSGPRGGGLLGIKDIKNVALVKINVTVPESGARRGDKLNCAVSSYNASSLRGGRLVFAALQGPNLKDPRVVAFCEGRIQLDDETAPNTGKVYDGCRMAEDFFNTFHANNQFILVIDKHHAGFQMANEVAEAINAIHSSDHLRQGTGQEGVEQGGGVAQALDQKSVVVNIPEQYKSQKVDFVSQVLSARMTEMQSEARVTINQRTGIITVNGDVEIGSVMISHKNLQIKTSDTIQTDSFRALELREGQQRSTSPRLEALVSAFNALGVDGQDRIDIIKQLHKGGHLHAKLIIE